MLILHIMTIFVAWLPDIVKAIAILHSKEKIALLEINCKYFCCLLL